MEIRLLTASDKEDLERLISITESDLTDSEYWLPIDRESRDHFFDPSWTEFYGLFMDDELIAAAGLFLNDHEFGESMDTLGMSHDHTAEIGRAMVHPQHRGNHYILDICDMIIQKARSKDIQRLISTVHPDNIPSRSSCIKLGMVRNKTYIKHNGFKRDIFLMEIR